MEPMMPSSNAELEDLSLELVQKNSKLSAKLHPIVRLSIADLVRSMNCYYSNFIEGHDTRPIDIDRALNKEFSSKPEQRQLQEEAVAHIAVQGMIDKGEDIEADPLTKEYVMWLHNEFCLRLPDEFLWVEDEAGKKIQVIPGKFRENHVQVGMHIPPAHNELDEHMKRFAEAYSPKVLNKSKRIIAAAAAHHRLLWIHPFVDGNGRVARLMSYAILLKLDTGNSLWSVARGLARNEAEYKKLLQQADANRQGDHDGRGNLSEQGLVLFCKFFLETCIDQIDYMYKLLKADELLGRIELYINEQVHLGKLRKESFSVLREVFYSGKVERGKVANVIGLSDRSASRVIAELLETELVSSETPRGPIKLNFPYKILGRWLPELYPI